MDPIRPTENTMAVGARPLPEASDQSRPTWNVALKSGLSTAFFLVGGMLLGGFIGFISESLVPHATTLVRTLIAAPIVILIMAGGSVAWGWNMAIQTGSSEKKRMAWAAVLSFVPALVILATILPIIEITLFENAAHPVLPIHILYTVLFVPTAFIISGITSYALGLAHSDPQLARRLSLRAGTAGALAFLFINTLMEFLGWQVGAPGAAERATMITVTMVGNAGAALMGGAVLGVSLANYLAKSERP